MPVASRNRIFQIAVTALLLAVATINFTATLDRRAEAPINDAFERALITYAVV